MSAKGSLRVFVALALLVSARAMNNGLGLRPQMGWNSWNYWQCNIDEKIIRSTADAMVSSGLLAAGYRYLNIDDCWQNATRDPQGNISPDPVKFPSGFKALADYVHSKGLLFGVYSDAGSKTCGGRPGSRGFEKQDANAYAAWGVDYLKYDNCNAPASDWVVDRYQAMSDALNATGRPIFFSLCEWGVADPWLWAPKLGNSWRTDDDIQDHWDDLLRSLDNTVGLSQFAGPGQWNDPDMLEVGNGGMTTNEYRAHFALWALLKAPLLVGCDIRNMTAATRGILLASEVIAINQDPLGVAGDLVWKQGPNEVYAGPLQDGSRAVVLFNRHTWATQYPISQITVQFADLGYSPTLQATVRDLYAQKDLGVFIGSFTGSVDIHDGLALKVTPLRSSPEHVHWRPKLVTH